MRFAQTRIGATLRSRSASTPGAILQPQPPPWESEVRRGTVVERSIVVIFLKPAGTRHARESARESSYANCRGKRHAAPRFSAGRIECGSAGRIASRLFQHG